MCVCVCVKVRQAHKPIDISRILIMSVTVPLYIRTQVKFKTNSLRGNSYILQPLQRLQRQTKGGTKQLVNSSQANPQSLNPESHTPEL